MARARPLAAQAPRPLDRVLADIRRQYGVAPAARRAWAEAHRQWLAELKANGKKPSLGSSPAMKRLGEVRAQVRARHRVLAEEVRRVAPSPEARSRSDLGASRPRRSGRQRRTGSSAGPDEPSADADPVAPPWRGRR